MSKWVKIDDQEAPVFYVNMGWPDYTIRLWMNGQPTKQTTVLSKADYKDWVKTLKKQGYMETSTTGERNASKIRENASSSNIRWFKGTTPPGILPNLQECSGRQRRHSRRSAV